jgi:vacuolar-type H+-ATPase subunit H
VADLKLDEEKLLKMVDQAAERARAGITYAVVEAKKQVAETKCGRAGAHVENR